MKWIASLCAGVALCGGTAVSAQDASPALRGSSPWHVDYAEENCRLVRTFGDSQSDVLFSLTGSQPGEPLRLVIASARLHRLDGSRAQIAFGAGDLGLALSKPLEGTFETFGKGLASVVERDPRRAVPIGGGHWEVVEWVEVRSAGAPVMRLNLGSMRTPFQALRKCVDDLAKGWGVDLGAHWNKTRRAEPKELFNALRPSDFSSTLVAGRRELVVSYRLLIDENGTPTRCVTEPTDNPPQFDTRVCDLLLKRARFSPALGEDGQPMKSYFASRFRYAEGR